MPGGALDGIKEPTRGFVIRGGREREEHFECLRDLYRSIPSLEIEGASVLDEFYWLDKDDPNSSLQRATVNRGEDAHTDGLFTLSEQAQKEIIKFFLATREEMENKRINEVFGGEFLNSNFWLYWRTMFAFEEWHSALEMKLYLHRFIYQINGMPNFSTLKFTKYNQYESLGAGRDVTPMGERRHRHAGSERETTRWRTPQRLRHALVRKTEGPT